MQSSVHITTRRWSGVPRIKCLKCRRECNAMSFLIKGDAHRSVQVTDGTGCMFSAAHNQPTPELCASCGLLQFVSVLLHFFCQQVMCAQRLTNWRRRDGFHQRLFSRLLGVVVVFSDEEGRCHQQTQDLQPFRPLHDMGGFFKRSGFAKGCIPRTFYFAVAGTVSSSKSFKFQEFASLVSHGFLVRPDHSDSSFQKPTLGTQNSAESQCYGKSAKTAHLVQS